MVLQELSKDTIRLIKSTQVITTPVSVVKELLENSLDAGATAVTIRLENHGFTLMEVRDNGTGIEEEDMKFIGKPHFTSKISTFADLGMLSTYGFRGEALASLCEVAEVFITTKTKDNVMGHTYTFDRSGGVVSTKPAAAPNGTAIMVRNLFKNLPVRKQYYSSAKRRKEELKKVEDLVLAFTLAAPRVHLTLSHDKCTIIQKSSVSNIQEALMSTFPAVYRDLVFREKSTEDVHVEAYLPGSGPCDNPSLSRTTPDRFFILVNQRPIFHKSIEKVIKAFYSQKVQGSHGRYPMGVMTVSVPPACMDINLEPNKTKIFLRNENQIIENIQEILSELYDPLDQLKKPNDENISDETDVTCTFGGLRENSKMQKKKENVDSTQSAEVMDSFLDVENTKSVSVCSGKIQAAFTNQAICGNVGKPKPVLSTIRSGKNYDNILEKNMFRKPFQVRQVEKEQENSSINSEKAPTGSTKLNIDKSCKEELNHDKNNGMCASTPKNLTDARFPCIPESSIIPDDDFDDFLYGNDSSVVKRFEDGLSGIAPLSVSCSSVVHESGIKENNSSTEHDHIDTFPRSCFDQNNLHISITGSDGIPVYKIPPLLPTDIEENEHKDHGNDNARSLNHQRKDISSRWSVDHISPCNTDLGNIQVGKSRGPEEREGSSGGAWSRGMPIDGKNIQTVQLLSTATLGLKSSSESNPAQDVAKRSKRHVPLEAGGLSAKPPKKTKINALAPVGHDFVHGNPVKKPSSPFILFSRDIRRQVLAEYPGADFAFVAKQMAERWKTLDQDSKNHYRELAKAEADKYHVEVKLIKERRGLISGSPLARGCKTAASLDRYIAPLTPYIKNKEVIEQRPLVADRPQLQHQKEIRCSVDIIKDKLKKRCPVRNYSDALTILGQVTSSGGWVCVQGSNILALNVYRVYEVVLLNNLLKTFKLSVKPLDDPILFNASTVGMQNWVTLLKLTRELVPDRNFYFVTDQRIIANGFHVALFPGATTSVAISHGEVTQMADTVGFYGINDLKEILSLMTALPHANLQQTRPTKLQHWIKAEAVRMVRSSPNILRQDDVLEKMKRLHVTLNGAEEANQLAIEEKCIHGRPFFTKLHSLENLPYSKQKHTKILNKEVFQSWL